MKLLPISAYEAHPCLTRVRELYSKDSHATHQIVEDAESADVILFVENTQFNDMAFSRLLQHPLTQRFPNKIFMYNEMDRAWPMFPGLYCSLSARMASHPQHIAFPYLTASNSGVEQIHRHTVRRKWLYSFVGSSSHPLRKKLLRLHGDNARIVDTSEFCTWDPVQTAKYQYQKLYTDTMAASKFVLCPRGIGPASLRLYETIEAGRVPVIISDSWVAPPQINWDFAIRIPEWDIESIPDRLHSLDSEALDRGKAARTAWESAYSPHQMFNTLASEIDSIRHLKRVNEKSLKITAHKWRVVLEQEARNWLTPSPVVNQPPVNVRGGGSVMHLLLDRILSR